MRLFNKIIIENFRCFRNKIEIPLSQGTYLIGINNAGKTATLTAVMFFFDDSLFQDESFLNKTAFIGKGRGYNRSNLSIEFNLEAIQTKRIKQSLTKAYGKNLLIKKIITITEISKKISISYQIGGDKFPNFDKLPEDIAKIIKGVKITYIQPQEGKTLLLNAQEKLRLRLLANWGRNYSFVTRSLRDVQSDWENFREKARQYLSSSLTDSIQNMWPQSEVMVDLPKKIEDIIDISEINFRTKAGQEIPLTSQGTGTQSTILYLAHYLLDNDRSLHRGEYHPIWLLEEPESFLHADLMTKFAKELNSNSWLDNIQMVISTHSPLILAVSSSGGRKIRWNLLENYTLSKTDTAKNWSESEIKDIGRIMGDDNFYFYFLASVGENLIFIEDSREETVSTFKKQNISITEGLKGVPEIIKYVDIFNNLYVNNILLQNVYFIIDGDKGKDDLSRFMTSLAEERTGFKRYKISDRVFLICLPDNFSVENLFNEYDNHLKECLHKLFDEILWKPLKGNIPGNLSRTHSLIRGKDIKNEEEAIKAITNTQDVKDSFWVKVKDRGFKFESSYIDILKKLLK